MGSHAQGASLTRHQGTQPVGGGVDIAVHMATSGILLGCTGGAACRRVTKQACSCVCAWGSFRGCFSACACPCTPLIEQTSSQNGRLVPACAMQVPYSPPTLSPAAAAGVAVGGAAFLCTVILLTAWLIHRRKRQRQGELAAAADKQDGTDSQSSSTRRVSPVGTSRLADHAACWQGAAWSNWDVPWYNFLCQPLRAASPGA